MTSPPRTVKQPGASLERPQSDLGFDVGINSSAAWHEHLDQGPFSDEETQGALLEFASDTRPARALYSFQGNAEFRELSIQAGDDIEVLREDAGDGWSLVRTSAGEVGLLPATYYTCTIDFISTPADQSEVHVQGQDISDIAIDDTPRASSKGNSAVSPVVPQSTGEWRNILPSFRQGLFGAKSLNRFSSFVTSGAEEWIVNGYPDVPLDDPISTPSHDRFMSADSIAQDNKLSMLGLGEADKHVVDIGPSWQSKIPKFHVLVHSPSKRTSGLSGAYTVYNLTSSFPGHHGLSSEFNGSCILADSSPTILITVQRRFSHFAVLHTALTKHLPGIVLPPLPEKQYVGRFNAEFVETRRGDLEQYINRVVQHPIARYAEVLTSFLGCEDDLEWKCRIPHFLSMPPAGPAFYAHVYHPAFNVDMKEALETADLFEKHVRAVGKGVEGLRSVFSRLREARLVMSKAEKLLSYSLLSLMAPRQSSEFDTINEETSSPMLKGVINDDGAWCWRDSCQDCLKTTKAIQKVIDALQSVSGLYDDHARCTMLATQHFLKNVAHPDIAYQGIIETQKATPYRCALATENDSNPELVSRCETVLNATLAEIDTYHNQKLDDFMTLTREHLDGEIALYEQILTRLKHARKAFEAPHFDELSKSPCRPSRFETDISFESDFERLVSQVQPLPQPSPHVYDALTPMRPVSAAIQGGVGLLLGTSSRAVGRTSVLSRLWA